MPNPSASFGGVQMPWSLRHARRGGMALHSSSHSIIMHQGQLVRDYRKHRDDFDTLTIANSAYWAVTNTGTSAADPVLNTQAGAAVRFVTGTSTPGVSVLYGARANHVVDDNPFFYFRFKTPAEPDTDFDFNIGLVNVSSTKTSDHIGDIDTPTVANGLTNGVIIGRQVGATLITPALIGVGTSIAVAKTNIADTAGTVWTPTASKWVDLYLGARVGFGYCEIWENDKFIGQFTVASGPDTATALFPMFQMRSHGTSETIDADVYQIIEERNTR